MARKRRRAKTSKDIDAQPIIPGEVESTAKEDAVASSKSIVEKKPAEKSAPSKTTAKATPSGGKINTFFKDVVNEAKKVSWPDLEKTAQSTGVVIATLFILGLCMTFFTVIFTRITAYIYEMPD